MNIPEIKKEPICPGIPEELAQLLSKYTPCIATDSPEGYWFTEYLLYSACGEWECTAGNLY